VDAPYRAGVALVGDAATACDPSWGCGMALALHDVRTLRDRLLASDDWDAAGRAYAAEHDRFYGALHRLEHWRAAFFEIGPEADARRARVLARLAAAAPGSAPDLAGLGPGPRRPRPRTSPAAARTARATRRPCVTSPESSPGSRASPTVAGGPGEPADACQALRDGTCGGNHWSPGRSIVALHRVRR